MFLWGSLWYSKSKLLFCGIIDVVKAVIYTESALVSTAVSHGLARHMFFLSLPKLSETLRWQAIAEPVGILGPCIPKVVVTMVLIKISGHPVACLWSLNFLLIGILIACSVVVFVQCDPVSAQ
jgi:hypothetical protein